VSIKIKLPDFNGLLLNFLYIFSFIQRMQTGSQYNLTFCFTDIKGSTRLSQKLGNKYPELLDRYRSIIRAALDKYDGNEIDSPGDGFFITFTDPLKAVRAAGMIQQHITVTEWPEEAGVRVRIGLNTGEAVKSDNGFTGPEVNKTARICDAARGGQVLLSVSTKKAIQDNLPSSTGLRNLGRYELKDFDAPEELYQFIIPYVENDFPPPRVMPAVPVVAVMPFSDLSTEHAYDSFCTGMSSEIIHALARIQGLRVVARSSSFALKGKTDDVREIAKKLNATVILEGTVNRLATHIGVHVDLIDASTGYTLWTGKYDRKIEDVFAIEDDIAYNTAQALEVQFIPISARKIKETQTGNVEAYDAYLRGRRFYYQFSHQSIEFALQMFRKAIEADPEYTLAYCGLADCYSYFYLYKESSEANLKAAENASLKALELDPKLAEASVARGVALSLSKDYSGARLAFEYAVELEPRLFSAYYQYGRVSFSEGKVQKAADLFREANRLRPEDYQSLLLAAQCFDDLGKKQLGKEMRMEGVAIVERYLKLNPGDTRALYMGANAQIVLGNIEKASDWLKRALSLEPEDPMLLYNAGCIYALANMPKEAITCLEMAVEAGAALKGWYLNDSNLDSLRDIPRFKALINKLT
jgi:TolB-like protein/Flp pilus assembly protein TadD